MFIYHVITRWLGHTFFSLFLFIQQVQEPVSLSFFVHNSYSVETPPCCNSLTDQQIATNFCTCHDSTAVVPRANFCGGVHCSQSHRFGFGDGKSQVKEHVNFPNIGFAFVICLDFCDFIQNGCCEESVCVMPLHNCGVLVFIAASHTDFLKVVYPTLPG